MKTKIRRIIGGWASVVMIISVAFFVVESPRASAGIPVGGYIDQDTLWASELSPYWVESDVIVRNGATLFIDSGVDVLFNGNYSIYIEVGAMLRVLKYSEPRPALFSSNFSIKSIGDWRAIQLNDSSYDQSIIQNSIIEYATYGIRLESASPTIYNNTIRNCTYGIYSNYGSPFIENNTVENCVLYGVYFLGNDPGGTYAEIENNRIVDNGWGGLNLEGSSNNLIRNNTVSNNYFSGISLESYSNYNTITHNLASSNYGEDGISLEYSNSNTIAYNTASSNYFNGIGIHHSSGNNVDNNTALNNFVGIHLRHSTDNNIINNIASSSRLMGIWLIYSSNSNTVSNNNVFNNEGRPGSDGYGIRIWDSSNNVLTNNNITNNDWGIWLGYSSNNNISNSNISSNNKDGIYLLGDTTDDIFNNIITWNDNAGINCTSSSDPTIKSNDIENNTRNGVWSEGGSDPVINYNNICNNGDVDGYGVINTYLLITIDAQNNWWNDPLGPGGVGPGDGDQVSSGVNYNPWSGTPF